VVGGWWLVVGGWWLVVGGWWLVLILVLGTSTWYLVLVSELKFQQMFVLDVCTCCSVLSI
jgi:hypothetical protein